MFCPKLVLSGGQKKSLGSKNFSRVFVGHLSDLLRSVLSVKVLHDLNIFNFTNNNGPIFSTYMYMLRATTILDFMIPGPRGGGVGGSNL